MKVDSFLRVHTLLLVAGYPIFSSVAVISDSGIFTALYRLIVIVTSLTAIFIRPILLNKKISYATLPILLFFLMYFSRVVYEVGITDSAGMGTEHYVVSFIFQLVLPTISMIGIQHLKSNQTQTLKIIFIIGLLFCILNIYLGHKQAITQALYGIRWGTERFNPISLGYFIIVTWLAGVCLLLNVNGVFYKRIAVISLTFCVIVAIFMTGSRGPLIVFILVFSIFLIIEGKLIKLLLLFLMFITLSPFILAVVSEVSFIDNISIFVDRLLDVGSNEDASSGIRIATYSQTLEQISLAPMFGSGLEEKNTMYYPHNIFLELWMVFGLVIGSVFIVALIFPIFLLAKYTSNFTRKGNELMCFFALVYIIYLMGGMFSASIISANIMFPSYVAVVVLFYSSEK